MEQESKNLFKHNLLCLGHFEEGPWQHLRLEPNALWMRIANWRSFSLIIYYVSQFTLYAKRQNYKKLYVRLTYCVQHNDAAKEVLRATSYYFKTLYDRLRKGSRRILKLRRKIPRRNSHKWSQDQKEAPVSTIGESTPLLQNDGMYSMSEWQITWHAGHCSSVFRMSPRTTSFSSMRWNPT